MEKYRIAILIAMNRSRKKKLVGTQRRRWVEKVISHYLHSLRVKSDWIVEEGDRVNLVSE